MTTKLYDLIRWGAESQEGYAPAYCRICGATLSTFDKTAPIGERLRWNGCEHIEAAGERPADISKGRNQDPKTE